ncbi:MAG: HipA N-terminal domain-containing protein [Pseudomonadota bacterium]
MKVDKINVFSQTVTKRVFVGILYREKGVFRFEYDKQYKRSKDAVALGPELELWKDSFSSKNLFPSIADRIPSKQNPAYGDYCKQWDISMDEEDPFRLLTTIGRRGPSTFVFEPALKNYSAEDVRAFRERLGLNQREFATLFNITQTTLSKIEKGKSSYTTIVLLIQLCDEMPHALAWLLENQGQFLHDDKRVVIEKLLSSI